MGWSSVPFEEREQLLSYYEQGNELKLVEYADLYDMSLENINRRIREHRTYKGEYAGRFLSTAKFPESPSRRYVDFPKIKTDDAIIISDIEIPDHNPIYLLLAQSVAIKRGIRTLIIAGDLIATDQHSLNSWTEVIQNGDELSYGQSLTVVKSILNEFGRWFDAIYVIEGNHDDRVARATGGQVHLGMLLPERDNLFYSRYSYLHLETSRGLVWVVHPQNFSGDPVVLGQKLYGNHSPKGHWILGHCHRRQDGKSPDGDFEIHALGCGRDPERTKYKQTRINTHKQWDRSFLAVHDAYHYPLDIQTTNWREELGSLYPVFLEKAQTYGVK